MTKSEIFLLGLQDVEKDANLDERNATKIFYTTFLNYLHIIYDSFFKHVMLAKKFYNFQISISQIS